MENDILVLRRNLENIFITNKDKLLQFISTKKYLLEYPDQHGNLPLHCHLGSRFIDKDILGVLLSLAPQTIRMQGRFGRLPLHCSMNYFTSFIKKKTNTKFISL